VLECDHRGERAELEIGERNGSARSLDPLERAAQHFVGCIASPDANALVVAQQVWRGVTRRAIARIVQNGFQHGATRAFAIGAADRNQRIGGIEAERLPDAQHTLEPHSDRLGMNLLEMREPAGEALGFQV
jgi:hypothetical protein